MFITLKSSQWHKWCHTTSWVASSNCLFSIISSLARGLSGSTSDVFVSQQEGWLVSYFLSHSLKVRSLFYLSYPSLRAGRGTCASVGVGRGSFVSIVRVKNGENKARTKESLSAVQTPVWCRWATKLKDRERLETSCITNSVTGFTSLECFAARQNMAQVKTV